MKIRAKSHIKHDGKLIAPGKTANLPDDVARHVIASGSAEAVEPDKKAGK